MSDGWSTPPGGEGWPTPPGGPGPQGWQPPPQGGGYGPQQGPFQPQHGFGYAQAYREPLRPLEGLATAASVLLGVMAVLAVVMSVMTRSFIDVARDYLVGSGTSQSDVQDAAGPVLAVVVIYLLGFIATAAVFITWQYRHAVNARSLGGVHGLGPGWSIGAWFIPCVNFVLPAVCLWQASQASDPQLPPNANASRGRGNPLVIAWAIAWVVQGFTSRFNPNTEYDSSSLTVAEKLDRLDSLKTSSTLIFVSAVGAVLAIAMVQSMTKKQAARAAFVAEAPGAPTPYSPYG